MEARATDIAGRVVGDANDHEPKDESVGESYEEAELRLEIERNEEAMIRMEIIDEAWTTLKPMGNTEMRKSCLAARFYNTEVYKQMSKRDVKGNSRSKILHREDDQLRARTYRARVRWMTVADLLCSPFEQGVYGQQATPDC
jgi:hypothetical protein